jgi:hypothetical protein
VIETPRGFAGRLLCVASIVAYGCAATPAPNTQLAVRVNETRTQVVLHGKTLDLHLARPAALSPGAPLVLYASGDGGWFGAAVDMWRQMGKAGYATAGFSARAFLKIERPRGSVMNPAQIALEYRTIVNDARRALGLDADAPVILTGWSRGAAFSVLIGTEPPFKDDILGVVAIGLAEDEDLQVNGAEDETDDGPAPVKGQKLPFDNYAHIAQLTHPCAVIQATHDNYFPAADARQRFGPDTPERRLYAIDAKNHRFSGATTSFHQALVDALRWIAPIASAHASPR